jgi:type IV secretion system protein VirB9
MHQQTTQRQTRESKEREWTSTSDIEGKRIDLSTLNFRYALKGKAPWKPERVYDDGRQMFIRLPDRSGSGEMPVLLVRKGKKDVLVNYRVKDSAMIVDGVYERLALVVGVGGEQEKVEIVREGK